MKKSLITAAVAGLALVGAACSADESDFKEEAEKFIESSDVGGQAGTTFSDATCTEPASVTAGEQFTCTAVAADGVTWEFTIEVQSKDSLLLVGGNPTS